MESVPHLKPLESYSEVKSSTDLLRNPFMGFRSKSVSQSRIQPFPGCP